MSIRSMTSPPQNPPGALSVASRDISVTCARLSIGVLECSKRLHEMIDRWSSKASLTSLPRPGTGSTKR